MTATRPPRSDSSVERWFQVQQLYTRCTSYLEEGALRAWVELFEPDCLYRVVSRENDRAGLPLSLMRCEGRPGLLDRVYAIENTATFRPRALRYLVSGLTVSAGDGNGAGGGDREGDGDGRWSARASFLVAQSLEGQLTQVYAAGEYRDELRWSAGEGLRFAARTAVYDGDLVDTSMVYPL